MKATGDKVALIDCGQKQYRMEYWTHWWSATRDGYIVRMNWLDTIGDYGKDYYYSHGELWFRKEKHLTMYLLKYGDQTK